jgi:hypothetical protein
LVSPLPAEANALIMTAPQLRRGAPLVRNGLLNALATAEPPPRNLRGGAPLAHMQGRGTPGGKPQAQHVEARAPIRSIALGIEQRQALAMLATAGRKGATQPLLSANGFGANTIAGLVNKGLATLMPEKARADGKLIEVTVRITAAGREALAAEGLAGEGKIASPRRAN